MKLIAFLLFFATCNIYGQEPLQLSIERITMVDSAQYVARLYTIEYSIKNLTGKDASFFLDTHNITSNVSASMALSPYFKIWQHDEPLNTNGILNKHYSQSMVARFSHEDISVRRKAVVDYIKEAHHLPDSAIVEKDGKFEIDTVNYGRNYARKIIDKTIVLKPFETKTFSIVVAWNRERYFKHDEHEYYLDESAPHHIELTINLMKELWKDRLTKKQFDAMMADPGFIKGVFVSNKVPIEFR